MDIDPMLSIITLNMNDLNTPIERQRLSEQIQKHNLIVCFLQEATLNIKLDRLKVKRQRKIYHSITNQKKAGVTLFQTMQTLE